MTSPHAATTEVVAAMASTEIHEDNPPRDLNQLTAVNAEEAGPQKERDEQSQTIPPEIPEENKETTIVGGNTGGTQVQNEEADGTMDAAIPDGANLSQDPQSGYPPMNIADLDMDALNALMMMQPMPYYNPTLNSMNLPPASADGLPALPMAMDGTIQPQPYLDPSPYIQEVDETRISAYAKLEFEDGEFYMNTYSVILGRDLAAARAAMRRDQEEAQRKLGQEMNATEPKTPIRIKREGSRYSKSVISESGGILREGNDYDSDERARRRERRNRKASKKSKSTGSSSQHMSMSRRNSLVMPNGHITYQPQPQVRRAAPETSGAVPVDPASLRPSPHDCPTVGIHPPASTNASGYKAISRQHVRIKFNTKKHLFEAEIIGRNGAFVDDEFYYHNDVIPLKSGSRLQIGGVVVRFVLPDTAIGETGAERRVEYEDNPFADRYSEGGKEMSFDFEETPRIGAQADTSEDASDDEQQADNEEEEDEPQEDEGDGEDDADVDAEGEEEEANEYGLAESVEEDDEGQEEQENRPDPAAGLANTAKPQKKRGPGRPPKNGIMSKREQQLAKKEALAQEKAKKTVPSVSETGKEGKVKNKVGRPRKHPRPDTPPIKTEKRKYTKRKPKEPTDPNSKQEGEGEEKKAKKEKPPKPPRSPSPTFNEADLTPEQMAKPAQNYVTLIYEALSNSATGQMSLPQIYRAIMRKYPFFVLKCNTNGWQSSVRHNLSQHHAFRKVERDGKGWMWAIVDGVSIEKEKKRKSPPPPPTYPQYNQPIYPGAPPPGYMYGPPPPGYVMPPMPPNYQPGQPQQHYMPGPPHMNGHPPPPGAHPPMNVQPPPGYPLPLPQVTLPGTGASGGATYSSPYASKPNTAASPPQPSDAQSQPQPQQPPPSGIQTPVQSQHPTLAQLPIQGQPTQGQPPMQSKPGNQALPSVQRSTPPSQGQTAAHNPSPAQGPIPTGAPHQPRSNPPVPGPSQPNEHVTRVVDAFRNNLVTSLKEKSDNAEEVVASAINRVLGITTQSTVPGNPHEDMIMTALSDMLSRIHGGNFKPAQQQVSQSQNMQQTPLALVNSTSTQSIVSQSPKPSDEKSGPTVMRPSFSGQGGSRPSVPRPPMMTPGMKRTNSDSPAPPRPSETASASPAPTPAVINGASTPTPTPVAGNENTQIAGQKRPLDDTDDMREFKRLSTSGPPQLKT